MRRLSRIVGVTLLEIMLVLAIAAMIIVMSVRYYQSAAISQQLNTLLAHIQAITAATDNLAQATGSYKNVTEPQLKTILPGGDNALNTPWGDKMGITFNDSNYTVTLGAIPTAVCTLLKPKLTSNNHYTVLDNCASYTYSATPTAKP